MAQKKTKTKKTTLGALIRAERTRLDLKQDQLALVTRIAPERLQAIEANKIGGRPTELQALSRVLGWDLAGWDPDECSKPTRAPQLKTLFKSSRRVLAVEDWQRVLDIAEVALDLVRLEQAMALPPRMQTIRNRWTPTSVSPRNPGGDGQSLAELARRDMDKEEAPFIPSMSQLCEQLGVLVLRAVLPPGIDALCFADDDHGPTAVLDATPGVHTFTQRFRLTHELCHILFDRAKTDPLQLIERLDYAIPEEKNEVEQRADAFSIQFLAPEDQFKHAWGASLASGSTREQALRVVMERFGIGFQAARGHALRLELLERDEAYVISDVDVVPSAEWDQQERTKADGVELSPIPRERRGRLATLALEALEKGVIGTSRVLELLRIDGDTLAQNRSGWLKIVQLA